MTQDWRIYNSNGNGDSKAELRDVFFRREFFGISPLSRLAKEDCDDDCYRMIVSGEEVLVVARAKGQGSFTRGVFEDKVSGIFYKVSDENCQKAEGILARVFG